MSAQQLPAGWDESRIKSVIDHYEHQTEEEQAAEIDAAFADEAVTVFTVRNELADEVRKLLASHQASRRAEAARPPV